MSTALALFQPRNLRRLQESLVPRILDFMGRRERLLFSFLHICKRIWIESGHSPTVCEATVLKDDLGHVHWWHISARHMLGPSYPPMHMAEDDDLLAVVVPLSRRVDMDSQAYAYYPDGWQELVAWCQAGCPYDERDQIAARIRVQNVNMDRLAALPLTGSEETFGRDDIETASPPALRVVQESAGPLFASDLAPVSMDLEADMEAEHAAKNEPIDADWEDIP